jgi:DNA-binding NtrC family response regulator
LQIQDLPEDIQNGISEATETLSKVSQISIPLRPVQGLKNDIQNMERERMRQALLETGGNKTKAMNVLGISRRTFYKKWKLYGFDNEIYTK